MQTYTFLIAHVLRLLSNVSTRISQYDFVGGRFSQYRRIYVNSNRYLAAKLYHITTYLLYIFLKKSPTCGLPQNFQINQPGFVYQRCARRKVP